MVERIVKEQGFMDFFLARRPNKNDFLDRVEELIDWRPINRLLSKHYRKRAAADGRPAYPPLPMFKMLLLQRWYNLSDPGLEAAMCVRLSFIRFAGLPFQSSVPDETTFCRFRNELPASGLHHKLLGQINKQLEALGLLVRVGAVVDATIVASSRRSRKVIDVIAEDRAEVEADEPPESGTDEAAEGAAVLADKGYISAANSGVLEERKLGNCIMKKAQRGKKLSELAKLRNRIISSYRFVVEQSASLMKRHYNFGRARYKGCLKVGLELHLIGMALNIKKGVGMLSG